MADKSTTESKSRVTVIEYVTKGCRKARVIESVQELDFHIYDVYRIVYKDAYTDQYSVERARRLTHCLPLRLRCCVFHCSSVQRQNSQTVTETDLGVKTLSCICI